MMRYFPFIIISFVLYVVFFYHSQEPKLLAVNKGEALNKQVIPLDFDNTLESELSKKIPIETLKINTIEMPPVVEIVLPTPALAATKKQENRVKMDAFYASVKSTPAKEGALLKGEFYERDFYLHLPPPPAEIKAPKKKKKSAKTSKKFTTAKVAATSSVSSELLKQVPSKASKNPEVNTATQKSDKPKRSFKKSVKPMQASSKQGLQEAIAVSGKQPQYPQKARKDKLKGTVSVTFTVSMQGKTRNPALATSSGHKILDSAVLEFIEKERFMPALKGIEKVTSEQQFSFTF